MLVRIVFPEEYFAAFPSSRNVYGSRGFNEVTAPNAEAVRYFVGYDESSSPRLGLIAGYKRDEWHAPYSAPFAEIAYQKPQQLERIYDFISELTHTLGAPLHISLPPALYDPEMLPKITGILGNYATRQYADFDYFYPLDRYPQFEDHLDRAARKNLHRALQQGFSFAKTDDLEAAYEVIRLNRLSHGYPLAMTLAQVRATAAVVEVDSFMLSLGGCDVAAAIVYHAAPSIAQVIYWGDVPLYSFLRPMNLLPYHLFGHYHSLGFNTVDIGPSSTSGIPNSGLCRFKESLGCSVALKPSFIFGS